MVICLERVADWHMTQLMPLPLTVSCFSKTQIDFAFLVPANLGSLRKRAVKWACVCCMCYVEIKKKFFYCHSLLIFHWWYVVEGMHHQGIFRIPGAQADINAYKLQFERGLFLLQFSVTASMEQAVNTAEAAAVDHCLSSPTEEFCSSLLRTAGTVWWLFVMCHRSHSRGCSASDLVAVTIYCRMTNYELLRWLVETPSRDIHRYWMLNVSAINGAILQILHCDMTM